MDLFPMDGAVLMVWECGEAVDGAGKYVSYVQAVNKPSEFCWKGLTSAIK
jgi:hypothetical protein